MKKLLLLTITLTCSENYFAQTSAQLDINNINATINTVYHPLFHNASNYSAGFEAPKGSGRTSIYMSDFWIGGKDSNDSLHLGIIGWGNGHDFIPGPIMDSIQYASQIPQWNRVWKIDRSDVISHINYFNQQGYTIPQMFVDWPAHGDTTLGQAYDLAPYFDYDNNGSYDPSQGDYPLVPGDQCVYYIFNDDTIHTASGGEKMGIEVHAFVYSFNCPTDSALQNTVFVKYKIINRGIKDYFNTSIGIFTDTDLGGAVDDFVGCNVQNGSYYVYNGDSIDENYQGAYGYGDSLAAQSITFLAGPYQDNDAIDNSLTTNIQNAIDSLGIPYDGLGLNYGDGIVDNERLGLKGACFPSNSAMPTGDPNTTADFYNYMTGKWKDGTQMVHGGNGHIGSGGTLPCTYMFPGDSDPLNWNTGGITPTNTNWNEITTLNNPADRRGMGWTGTFIFESGSTEEIDLAYVFARDYQTLNDPQAPVAIMNSRIDDIRNYFIAQQTPCYTFYTYAGINEQTENISFNIYPNPASNNFILSYEGNGTGLIFSVHDILGKEVVSGKINSSQTQIDCSDWSKGVYLVKVGNENGYKTEKLIIE